MSEINDRTCEIIPGETDTGTPIFSVILKRTYTIVPDKPAVRCERTFPLVKNDDYYDEGDPQVHAIRHETDLVPYKIATDVVFVGKAYAPTGAPARRMRAALSVGPHRKELLIVGDRTGEFRPGQLPLFSEPAEFTEMEIRYERAYGGTDAQSDPELPFTYPRNHVGTGFVIKNLKGTVDGLVLPNIEDPADPLTPARLIAEDVTRWNRQPLPQGLGWFHRVWYPRCSFLSAMPAFVPLGEVMREEELGLVPKGQADLARAFRLPARDPRFFNGASIGLAVPYLNGDEPVRLENLTPTGSLQFSLPGEVPSIRLDIGMGEKSLPPVLHSVTIRCEENEVDLVWRAAHPYPGVDWLPKMTGMRLSVT